MRQENGHKDYIMYFILKNFNFADLARYFEGDDGSDLLGFSEIQMILTKLGIIEARKWVHRL